MPWGNRKRRVGGSHLAPWQRAFAAAAYNALHAGLASGALRGDCYGTGAICPTDTGSTTPSDVLLDTAADGSTTNFDTQVAVAAAVVYTICPNRPASASRSPARRRLPCSTGPAGCARR
jgi:hypothetical protein